MKKLIVMVVAITALALAFGPVSSVFANSGSGNGFGGNGAGMAGQTSTSAPLDGVLEEYYITAYADAFNLSVDEIESRLADGETLSSIALSTGLTLDEFKTIVAEARASALGAAVVDGVISQTQADWLLSHMGGANSRTMGATTRAAGVGNSMRFSASCSYKQAMQ